MVSKNFKAFKVIHSFLVNHSYKISGYCDEVKHIGLFSSKKNAQKAIKKLINQEGFIKHKKGFYIKKFLLDQKYKKKDLDYIKSRNTNKNRIYVLKYDKECLDNNIIGLFSSEKKANTAFRRLKKTKDILLQKSVINQIYWDGGFFSY